jgi:hypothetical protein
LKITLIIFIIITAITSGHGQSIKSNDTCAVAGLLNVELAIPGSVDTLQNGFAGKVVNAADLVNGFELNSKDTAVKIIYFQVVFNDDQGTIYVKQSTGNKIADDEKHLFSIAKIKESSIITIENIYVQYKNTCYKAKSQLYLCR